MKTKINIWAESHNEFSNQSKDLSMYKLVDMWISKYPDIIFERKSYLDPLNVNEIIFEDTKFIRDQLSSFYFFIENENTKKYFLVSYWDIAAHTIWNIKNNHDYENLVEFFTAQGCQDKKNCLIESKDLNYTPLNKVLWLSDFELEVKRLTDLGEENNKKRIIPEKPFFYCSGDGYGLRRFLKSDNRFDARIGNRISEVQHVQELNKSWINMDVYSASGVSMRLIEGFGLGTVVLSPKFPQRHHSPIIPNYHFVEVEFDEEHLDFSNYQKLADSYIDTFEKLKKDQDRIRYISDNARKYYLENCTFDKYVNSLYELIDINKIT